MMKVITSQQRSFKKVEFMWDDYHRQQLEELEAEEEDDWDDDWDEDAVSLLQPERQGSR
jgi:GTP-binding protein